MKHIGRQACRACDAAEVKSRGRQHKPVEYAATDGRTYKLSCHIANELLETHTACEPHGELYCRIDMATRDVAYGVAQAHQYEPETETDT